MFFLLMVTQNTMRTCRVKLLILNAFDFDFLRFLRLTGSKHPEKSRSGSIASDGADLDHVKRLNFNLQ